MEKTIAEYLLEIKAVFLRPNEPFTWASGIKSPIYCDNRLTLSYPVVRNEVKKGLASLVKMHYPNVQCLMGTATAGIAHAALAADELGIPMGYVRGGQKQHGRNNQIEGMIFPGMKVVVVEDLLSTGKSSLECIEALQEAGCEVIGLIAIFSYELPKLKENFANIEYHTLTNYDTLIEVAVSKQYIEAQDLEKLKQWKLDPSNPSWMNN